MRHLLFKGFFPILIGEPNIYIAIFIRVLEVTPRGTLCTT